MSKIFSGALSVGLGYLSGGPLGAALAGASLLFGSKGQEVGKLSQLTIQTATEGADLVRGYGTWRQAGILIFSTGLSEKKKKHGGKGKPKYTEFSYQTSAIVLGGMGPIDRFDQIKLNTKVIYDRTTGKGVSFDYDASTGFYTGTYDGCEITVFSGHANQPVLPMMEEIKGVNQWTSYPTLWGIAFKNLKLTKDFGNAMPNVTAVVHNSVTDLADVVEEICCTLLQSEALTPDDLDLSALVGISVAPGTREGFVIGSRGTAASWLQQLMSAYQFRLPEVDGVLRAVKNGQAPVAFLKADDLRIGTPESPWPESEWVLPDEAEQFGVQEIAFYDAGREWSPGFRQWRNPSALSARTDSLSLSLSTNGARGSQLARIIGLEKIARSESVQLSLGFKHLYLSAADVIRVPLVQEGAAQGSRDVALPDLTTGLLGPVTGRAVVSDALIYGITPQPDTAGLPDAIVSQYDAPIVFAFDTRAVRDDDLQEPGFYLAATVTLGSRFDTLAFQMPAHPSWLRGDLTLEEIAIIGEAVNVLPDFAGGSSVWDRNSTVQVDFWQDDGLGGVSEAAVLEGANAFLCESGEIVQFTRAVPIVNPADPRGLWDGRARWQFGGVDSGGNGGALRGRRGSEPSMSAHAVGEKWLFLDGGAWKRLEVVAQALNRPLELAVFWPGQEEYEATNPPLTVDVAVTGRNLLPLSPVAAKGVRDGSGVVTLSWMRRDRAATFDGELPFSEADERYVVEIYDGATLKRTLPITTTPLALYGAGMQLADFGVLPASFEICVYQLSRRVGRGDGGRFTIEPQSL